jgi:hypothetical protein
VGLSATDDVGGASGVKTITYSASGAQTINSTTVSGASASFVVSAQGTTTVTYGATDLANNASTPQTQTVMIDSVPPTDVATATIPSGGGTVTYTPGRTRT